MDARASAGLGRTAFLEEAASELNLKDGEEAAELASPRGGKPRVRRLLCHADQLLDTERICLLRSLQFLLLSCRQGVEQSVLLPTDF